MRRVSKCCSLLKVNMCNNESYGSFKCELRMHIIACETLVENDAPNQFDTVTCPSDKIAHDVFVVGESILSYLSGR